MFEETQEETTQESESANTVDSVNPTPSNFKYSEVNQNMVQGMSIPGAGGVFDQKFYDGFLQIIEKNNVEGIDYFEFARAKKANDAIPGMAESMKFQVAFATLKANAPILTKDTLIQTADFYVTKLDEEEKNFNSEMQSEIESEVNSRISQAQSKQNEIAQKQEEINKLQLEIGTLNGEIGALNIEAQNVKAKIESTAKNFKVSLEVLKSQIAQDKVNIQQFIN